MTGPRSRARRVAAFRFGRTAEALCALRLILSGYRVLARGLRTPGGEIDIVARRGRRLLFVEVKGRPGTAAAIEALDMRKRRRVERAAEAFLGRHPELAALTTRFDVMIVLPWPHPRCFWPVHIADAWRPGLA